ncbi:MAG: Mrp/NBP35 family ATP-binding protein [Bacteroidales bacterium]|nr:Mrp/NBP35 family ATP-binding protein [Bacteroidales bacterium]
MKDRILDVLSGVIHPAYQENIVRLGLVENLKADDKTISFQLVFTRRDPLAGSIKQACTEALKEAFPQHEVQILELVREKKAKSSSPADLGMEELQHIGKIIVIASGKGGVGKSTVAVNLAVSLARRGYRVGLADADVYGPSVPKMTGTEGMMPQALERETEEGTQQLILPLEKYGVKWMSIGYFASPEQALIWRGPMACNALKQIILQVQWGELDYLLIDLPPGTGDIHITLVNDIPVDGAIIVTTPQAVALADVEKGINMFRNPKIDKHIYGIIENMAWFTPAELPDNRYYIFGKDGSKAIAAKYGIDILAQIPLVQSICEKGDEGAPEALDPNSVISKALDNIVL